MCLSSQVTLMVKDNRSENRRIKTSNELKRSGVDKFNFFRSFFLIFYFSLNDLHTTAIWYYLKQNLNTIWNILATAAPRCFQTLKLTALFKDWWFICMYRVYQYRKLSIHYLPAFSRNQNAAFWALYKK